MKEFYVGLAKLKCFIVTHFIVLQSHFNFLG